MKEIVPLNLHYQIPLLNISEMPGRCASLLRAADKKPYSVVIDRLTDMAAHITPEPVGGSKLDLYLTGSVLTDAFFKSSKDYEDIDLVGVSNDVVVNYLCAQIVSKQDGWKKSVFDYKNTPFAVRQVNLEQRLIKGGAKRFIIAKYFKNPSKPIDLTLIPSKELEKEIVTRKLSVN